MRKVNDHPALDNDFSEFRIAIISTQNLYHPIINRNTSVILNS